MAKTLLHLLGDLLLLSCAVLFLDQNVLVLTWIWHRARQESRGSCRNRCLFQHKDSGKRIKQPCLGIPNHPFLVSQFDLSLETSWNQHSGATKSRGTGPGGELLYFSYLRIGWFHGRSQVDGRNHGRSRMNWEGRGEWARRVKKGMESSENSWDYSRCIRTTKRCLAFLHCFASLGLELPAPWWNGCGMCFTFLFLADCPSRAVI